MWEHNFSKFVNTRKLAQVCKILLHILLFANINPAAQLNIYQYIFTASPDHCPMIELRLFEQMLVSRQSSTRQANVNFTTHKN